jgi:pimeloyl-ACP methyl ester carboxylesterase
MREEVILDNKIIHFESNGKGLPIMLVHGYLESGKIWGDFAEILEKQFHVIKIDLPGFGQSEVLAGIHTMELYADAILSVVNHLNLEQFLLVGHSLGGYASLAFLEKYPQKLRGFCLFHSHPYPDSEQTIENRRREISLVKGGKQELIFNLNIPNGFAEKNLKKCTCEIDVAKLIAARTDPNGIIAALNGMMERPSREVFLEKTDLPVLLILGKYDNYIPYQKIGLQIKLPAQGKVETLNNSGHMGFIEEKSLSVSIITEFANNL